MNKSKKIAGQTSYVSRCLTLVGIAVLLLFVLALVYILVLNTSQIATENRILSKISCHGMVYQKNWQGRVVLLKYLDEQLPFVENAIREISKFRMLRELTFPHSTLSEKDLISLSELEYLVRLSLANSSIDDSGLLQLQKSPSLKFLDVSGTSVTSRGFLMFSSSRPDIEVLWYPNGERVIPMGADSSK